MRKQRIIRILIITGSTLLSTPVVNASALTPFLQQTETLVNQGNSQKAAQSLRQAMTHLYNQSNLQVEKALLIKTRPVSMGRYLAKMGNRYKSNEPILLYVEPVGYHFVQKDKNYAFGITVDLSLADEQGNILGGKKGFGTWNLLSVDRPLFDFYMTLTYNFTGIKPGKYRILTTLRDNNGDSSTQIDTPIEITP